MIQEQNEQISSISQTFNIEVTRAQIGVRCVASSESKVFSVSVGAVS
jgi:hypothetical protein